MALAETRESAASCRSRHVSAPPRDMQEPTAALPYHPKPEPLDILKSPIPWRTTQPIPTWGRGTRSICRYDFLLRRPKAGLFECTWPKGDPPTIPVLHNAEVFTGTEYSVAALMPYEGLDAGRIGAGAGPPRPLRRHETQPVERDSSARPLCPSAGIRGTEVVFPASQRDA